MYKSIAGDRRNLNRIVSYVHVIQAGWSNGAIDNVKARYRENIDSCSTNLDPGAVGFNQLRNNESADISCYAISLRQIAFHNPSIPLNPFGCGYRECSNNRRGSSRSSHWLWRHNSNRKCSISRNSSGSRSLGSSRNISLRTRSSGYLCSNIRSTLRSNKCSRGFQRSDHSRVCDRHGKDCLRSQVNQHASRSNACNGHRQSLSVDEITSTDNGSKIEVKSTRQRIRLFRKWHRKRLLALIGGNHRRSSC